MTLSLYWPLFILKRNFALIPRRKIPFLLALLTILAGFSGLVGWYLQMPALYTFLSHGASMKFNTALFITILGLSLFLATEEKRTAASVLCSLVLLFSTLTLAEHLLNIDFKIDQLLVIDTFTDAKEEHPGRMSAFTAFAFFLTTMGFEFALFKKYVWGQLILTVALLAIYAAFVGILFNINGLFTFGQYSSIALPTSIGLLSATLGCLSCTAHQGWLREIFSEYSAAVTARYAVLSFFLILPVFAGLLSLMLAKTDVSPGFAIVVLVTGFAALSYQLPFLY